MPAFLFTAALATGQPSSETVLRVDPAASARISVVQDLSVIVSGTAPFIPSSTARQLAGGWNTGSVTIRRSGSGIASTSVDTGTNSAALAATAVSARLTLSSPAAR